MFRISSAIPIIFFLLFWEGVRVSILGQDAATIDSLYRQLELSAPDTQRVLLLCELAAQLAEIDSSKALSYTSEALSLSQRLNYSYGEGYALHMMGYVYDYNYGFAQALDYYIQSLAIKEKNNDISGVAATLTNIGVVHYFQDDMDKALEYYQKALDKRIDLKDSVAMTALFNNMAAVLRRKGQYEEALTLYQKAIAIREAIRDKKGLANSYSNLSTLYLVQSNYEAALNYEQKALELEIELDNLRGIAHSLGSMGNIYYQKKTYNLAYKALIEAIVFADSSQAYDVLQRVYYTLSELDSLQGRQTEALEHYKKYIYYKEFIFKEEEKKRISVLQTIYETEKKEHALEKNEKEKQLLLKENILQQQSTRFWILFSLASALLLGLLWNQNRIRRQNYLLLKEKNHQIAQALAEKELLLKEIHHRVKNNLQIVSGLLHWQWQQSGNEEIKKTVAEGKNRLKSMAMIHQRLYSENNLKSIVLNDYVSELGQELLSSYGLNDSEIGLEIDIEPLVLDVDTMIPLGLILTELISNALKHAFPQQKGKIIVSIKKEPNTLRLQISDNGIGLTSQSSTNDKSSKSFGLQLVETLAQKLDAQLDIKQDIGTCITLIIHRFTAL